MRNDKIPQEGTGCTHPKYKTHTYTVLHVVNVHFCVLAYEKLSVFDRLILVYWVLLYTRFKSMNHNSPDCEQPYYWPRCTCKSPSAQDAFLPIPGFISCAGATGSGRITCHAHVTLMTGLKMFPETL